MTIRLGSNVSSLTAQRKLADGTAALAKTFERLSSGQRINRASDDAAGLSIADSLNVGSRVYNQGVRNLNDGLSLLNIADSAIETLSDIIIRLEELAEQAANGPYSVVQRLSLDDEAQALAAEHQRILATTAFNGRKVFSSKETRLQAGYGLDESLAFTLGASSSGGSGAGQGSGDGTFTVGGAFTTGSGPRRASVGDFDGDGKMDLTVVEYLSDTVSVFIGNGDGTFKARTSLATGDGPRGVAAGDIDQNGTLDMVTTDRLVDRISIFIGNGDGTFDARVTKFARELRSIRLVDFDGDADLDVVGAGGDVAHIVGIYLGHGDGTFDAQVTYQTGSNTNPSEHAVGDFNGDGDLDIATTNNSDSSVSVLLGNGDGTLQASVIYASNAGIGSIVTGDIDEDGDLDLVTGQTGGGTDISVLFGNGDGTFQAPQVIAQGSQEVVLADFNADGNLDLFSAQDSSSYAQVLLGNGNGTFKAPTSYGITGGSRAAVADVNSDNVQDIVLTVSGALTMLLGNAQSGGSDDDDTEISSSLPTFSLRTQGDARTALTVMSDAREDALSDRSDIGAFQSRIEMAVQNLGSRRDNLRAAESRIRDADIAEESSRLVRLNILQQAASSVLAQANQQPALALQLLRG